MSCSGDAGMATKGQKKRLGGWWTETVMTIDEQGLLTPHMYVCTCVEGLFSCSGCTHFVHMPEDGQPQGLMVMSMSSLNSLL